ncbi:hypothetical protein AK812_SmicGene5540 [Symbiodinium microadriaticum]|uniref:Uncharacterized protein n=1 Tax=Symbiodinium microadriaticum TaxID=2951 RepID=A0A1Q9ETE2_SYMMI|nr:hypothetical protein AK812_SmicGene5540 [Symbiodinium microadriaticum]
MPALRVCESKPCSGHRGGNLRPAFADEEKKPVAKKKKKKTAEKPKTKAAPSTKKKKKQDMLFRSCEDLVVAVPASRYSATCFLHPCNLAPDPKEDKKVQAADKKEDKKEGKKADKKEEKGKSADKKEDQKEDEKGDKKDQEVKAAADKKEDQKEDEKGDKKDQEVKAAADKKEDQKEDEDEKDDDEPEPSSGSDPRQHPFRVAASSSCSGSEAHGPGPDFEQIEEEGRLARQSGQSGSLQGVGEGQAVGAGASASPDGRRDAAIGILASAVQFQFIACAQRYFPLKVPVDQVAVPEAVRQRLPPAPEPVAEPKVPPPPPPPSPAPPSLVPSPALVTAPFSFAALGVLPLIFMNAAVASVSQSPLQSPSLSNVAFAD